MMQIPLVSAGLPVWNNYLNDVDTFFVSYILRSSTIQFSFIINVICLLSLYVSNFGFIAGTDVLTY